MISVSDRAMEIAGILDAKKAQEIVILKVGGMTIISDYFVVASAGSVTHVQTLAEDLQMKMFEKLGEKPARVEGERQGRWIVIDYGDVLVHLFHKEERDFYQIERLWKTEDNYYDFTQDSKEGK
jgi:ribosome-associated protein